MFCRKCGKEMPEGSTFCPSCGEKNDSEAGVTRIQLKCSTCNGTMEADPASQTLFCPYCGSKEIIKSSDSVEIEKIKTEAYKEVEFAKMKHQDEKEAKAEAKEARQAYKKSKFSKVTLVFSIIFLIAGFAEFSEHPLGGIIAIIQGGLLLASWLMGMQFIAEKKKNLHVLLAVVGFVLTILFFICISGSEDKDEAKNDLNEDEIYASLEAEIEEYEKNVVTSVSESSAETIKESTEASEEQETESTEEPEVEEPETEEKPEEEKENESILSNVVDPDLKEFLDSYEAFMDEYIEFLENYDKSDNALLMLADYTKLVQKQQEFAEAAEKYDSDSMSPIDSAYYLEVMGRINLKLAKAAGYGF